MMADRDLTLILRLRDETRAVLEGVKKALADIDGATKGSGVSGLGTQAKSAASGVKDLTTGVSELANRSTSLASTLAGVGTALLGMGLVRTLKDFADTAARVETLSIVMNTVAVNAGISETAVGKLDQQVQKLGITSSASKTAITAMIQAGLDVNKAPALARAAQDLAVLANKNSSELFQNIITNIQQMDTVGLRYNGVVLDMEAATAKYARTIGKSAADLTNTERQQAALNGVLEEAAKSAGVYEKSLSAVGKALQSLGRYQEEAKRSAGEFLLPAYMALVREFTTFLEQSRLLTSEYGSHSKGAQDLARAVQTMASAIREASIWVLKHLDVIGPLLAAYASLMAFAIGLRALAASWALVLPILTAVGSEILMIAYTAFPAATAAAVTFFTAFREGLVATARTPGGIVVLGLIAVAATQAAKAWSNYTDARDRALAAQTAANPNLNNLEREKQLHALVLEMVEKENAVKEAAIELSGAEQSKDADRIVVAKNKLDLLKKEKIATTELFLAAKAMAENQGVNVDKTLKLAETNLATKQVMDAAKAIDERIKKLKLDSNAQLKGIEISKEFEEQLGNAQALLRDFVQRTPDPAGGVKVSFQQALLILKRASEGAKSVDELTASLEFLIESQKTLKSTAVDRLIESTQFKLGKAAVDELNTSLSGFIEQEKVAAENSARLRDVFTETARFAATTSAKFLELGGAVKVASNGMMTLDQSVSGFATRSTEVLAAEIAATTASVKASETKYREDVAGAKRAYEAKKELAQKALLEGTSKGPEQLIALERDFAAKSIEIEKARYDTLRQLQKEYTDNIIASTNKINAANRELVALQRSEAKDLFDIRMTGLSAEEKRQATLINLGTMEYEANKAHLEKNYELEKTINAERIAAAKAIATDASAPYEDRVRATSMLTKAYKDQSKVVTELRDAEEERRKANIEAQNAVVAALGKVSVALEKLGGDVQTKVLVDTTEYDALMERIKEGAKFKLAAEMAQDSIATAKKAIEDGMKGAKVVVDIVASPESVARLNARGYADGGPIRGPGTGTSDSILMFGSNGEFVQPADAVQFYGEDFMERIRTKTLGRSVPAFAAGGMVGGSQEGKSSEGTQTTLNINMNGRPIGKVRGSRDTVSNLVAALKEIERGVL